jgi:rhomboid protease GluP
MEEFANRLARATPRMWVTPVIVALNAAVWLLNVAFGVDPMEPLSADLLDWGANKWPETLAQPWRLVGATFLHGGALHLAMNMWALWDTGRIAERFYGNSQFLLIYLVSGVFGSLTSLFFAARTGVSIGASGAVFGVMGALLAALFLKHHKLPPGLARSMRGSMLAFTVFSLFMGFTSSHVDNSAHVGGLLAGLALGGILVQKFDFETFERHAIPRAALAIALSASAGYLLWRLLPLPAA